MDYSFFLPKKLSGIMEDMNRACFTISLSLLSEAKAAESVASISTPHPFINTTVLGSSFSTFGLDAIMIMPPPHLLHLHSSQAHQQATESF